MSVWLRIGIMCSSVAALNFFGGIFRVKNHDFTPKNHIFSNCGGRREMFWVFRVKNHDFTPKNHICSNFRGGGGRRVHTPFPWIRTWCTQIKTYNRLVFRQKGQNDEQ
jgi:hypothetical protein